MEIIPPSGPFLLETIQRQVEINVFCLFGKRVKPHLPVSPYSCIPSMTVTWGHGYRLYTQAGKDLREGYLGIAGKHWGMVEDEGHFVRLHNNALCLTTSKQHTSCLIADRGHSPRPRTEPGFQESVWTTLWRRCFST